MDEKNNDIADVKKLTWGVILPVAFLIAVTFISCGSGIAIVVFAFKNLP